MELFNIKFIIVSVCTVSFIFYRMYKFSTYAIVINSVFIFISLVLLFILNNNLMLFAKSLLYYGCPMILSNLVMYVILCKETEPVKMKDKYKVRFKIKQGKFQINNIKRGVSIIGAAGSGKTESVIYNFMQHFSKYSFSGIIHDYKDFELTEIAYPLFQKSKINFYTISFDPIYHRVNPIAPRYIPNEESVNEISKIILQNLLEQKETHTGGASKFFNDAVEGLIGGLIWRMKTDYPEYCTLPHIIAVYQFLNTESLVAFLSSDPISKSMANAFIDGVPSERQTAAVKSTLANAFKKISTQKIFMVLSKDEIPLDINSEKNLGVISVVNNPKYETAYAPIIATIIHTVTKQMSVRNKSSSFVLMEEAPTIRLLNMHRIPATLRSYDIATIYVMQDKVQNDILYGDKESKAILSNLSYQFFGKVNDPDTSKYYERFFEIVKRKTISINRGFNLNFDTRITKGEKEVAKIRADEFFRLKQGEFVTFADGKDMKVQFKLQDVKKEMPEGAMIYNEEDLRLNYERIHFEAKSIFC